MNLCRVSVAVEPRFHRLVQADLNKILSKYSEISADLSDGFYYQFMEDVRLVVAQPTMFDFDALGLRRHNLKRFPYHFLFDVQSDCVRVWVLRHDKQRPVFGVRRFAR